MTSRNSAALALFLAARKLGRGKPAAGGDERSGRDSEQRADGPLVWMHVASEAEAQGIADLIDRLREERGDISVLLTEARGASRTSLPERLPRDVVVCPAPDGSDKSAANFLSHWRPDLAVWVDNQLDPALIEATHRADIPLLLINARVPPRPGWRWLPGLRRALLKRFSYVLAGDEMALKGLQSLGVPDDRIEMAGFLQESSAPLPCSQAERDSLADILAARPVWLAAGVSAGEVDWVVRAHRTVMRRSHRLLLVLIPAVAQDGAAIAARLEAEGWVAGLRSRNDEPDRDTEIYIADDPDELGLWYRLSPIALMGGTLLGESRPYNPFEAAALGSAVLFGPHVGAWRESYDRLREASAARAVADVASLTRALEYLLAPDKAAQMVMAAWEVTTSGAEATDRAVELVLDALEQRGV